MYTLSDEIPGSFLLQLQHLVGDENISISFPDRLAYARDQWPKSLLKQRKGVFEQLPLAVVWPNTPIEVAQVLDLCREFQTSVIPTGAGSAVTGALLAKHAGIAIDMKRLNRIRSIDSMSGFAEVEAGIIGMHLEEFLNEEGWTLGHFPSSILCSTLGGWIATRSAGQSSSSYGKIEDMVMELEVATTDGSLQWFQHPSLVQLITGCEAVLGIITAARIRIHTNPTARSFHGILFPSVEAGLESFREMMQSMNRPPAILRLYDTLDSWISSHARVKNIVDENGVDHSAQASLPFPKKKEEIEPSLSNLPKRLARLAKAHGKENLDLILQRGSLLSKVIDKVLPSQALMIVGTEANDFSVAQSKMETVLEICSQKGGKDLGTGSGWHWFHHRYDVSYKQALVFRTGAFSDTFEVASDWSKLPTLYNDVRKAIQKDALVMAHFSHAYPEGCSIYFTFASASTDKAQELQLYDRIWANAMKAAHQAGGTISHHHSIGFSKVKMFEKEMGTHGMELLSAVQKAFSPDYFISPGKLGLEERS